MKTPIEVKEVIDHERGCGWRKAGGLYLRSDGISAPCGKLPIPLTACPCCGEGVKPARGWTWFQPGPFVEAVACVFDPIKDCNHCPLSTPPAKAGLLWIGEKFYPTPGDWLKEAKDLGVSRRISMVPQGFVVGKTWVFAAHRKCISEILPGNEEKWTPGIFHVWKPDRIEYVTKGDETQEQLEALVKRGITPVKVKRFGELPLAENVARDTAGEPVPDDVDGSGGEA